jgi:hypothetical protein
VAEDGFSERYGDLLYGSYDCVDRIVLNAYYPLGYNPGGFRTWWRQLHGDDEQLDNTHLMRMAGRFARRVRASATARHSGDRLQARGTQTPDRRGLPRGAHRGLRRVPDPGRPRGRPGLGGHPLGGWGAVQPDQETGVRQPLLLPHHGPGVGTHDDQDVRASTVSARRSSSTATSMSPPPPAPAGSDTSRRATASPASPTPPPWPRSQTPCRSPRR